MSESPDAIEKTLNQLLRDLELGDGVEDLESSAELAEFLEFAKGSGESFFRVAFDVSLVAGVLGNWSFALSTVHQLLSRGYTTNTIKLWQLRCLIELRRYSESLAIIDHQTWSASEMLHINYFAGVAFLSLGMKEQARQRFEAVKSNNASYQNVAELLLKI